MKIVVLALAALLAGCTTPPRPPEPVVVTKEVKVPVPVPCKVERPQRPKETFLDAPADVYERGVALMKDNKALSDYSTLLEKALDGCTSVN